MHVIASWYELCSLRMNSSRSTSGSVKLGSCATRRSRRLRGPARREAGGGGSRKIWLGRTGRHAPSWHGYQTHVCLKPAFELEGVCTTSIASVFVSSMATSDGGGAVAAGSSRTQRCGGTTQSAVSRGRAR
eukprot:7377792-Prymnesium_polylepis.1